MRPAFRFAPSPNGYLHLGHAASALFTARAAEQAGGRFLLRIEDIDTLRCRPEFITACCEDLAWLGLHWEEPVRCQSEHMADYTAALARLEAMGLLYPCFCSRSEIAAAAQGQCDPEGAPLYAGTCRHLPPGLLAERRAAGIPAALRLDMARALAQSPALSFNELSENRRIAADPARWGDVVLARKDIGTSYHLAVVTDDALQAISHVTRGRDLFAATDVHRLLQHLLGLPEPAYHHHPLITDETGRKLSKSANDRALRSLRAQGISAAEIRASLGY